MTEHNPDNLTPEQYGAPEWRLLNIGELIQAGDQYGPFPGPTPQAWDTVSEHGGLRNSPVELHCTVRRRVTQPTAPQCECDRKGSFTYLVSYGGGVGPDVWDNDKLITHCVDIHDALAQARGVEDDGGWIFAISQEDYPPKTREALESELATLRAELAEARRLHSELLYQVGNKKAEQQGSGIAQTTKLDAASQPDRANIISPQQNNTPTSNQ